MPSRKVSRLCLRYMLPLLLMGSSILAARSDISDKYSPEVFSRQEGVTVSPFDLYQVRLQPSPFVSRMNADKAYLLRLDADRMLSWFRKEAGLKPKAPVYGGWEDQGVAGCIAGHYLSAASMMYQATGDKRLLNRVNYMVSQMAKCQKANGNGYLSAIPNGKNIFKEISEGHIDISNGLNGGWVPWYTMHKVMAGLRDSYLYCNNQTAKEVLIKLADWVDTTTHNLSEKQMQKMLEVEQGGMDEVLADVYAITGNPKYIKLAERFCHQKMLIPFSKGVDNLTGLHANTQIPKFIGFQRIYELTDDKTYNKAAENFWNAVVRNRSWVNGSNSMYEGFFDPHQFPWAVVQPGGPETCNTYNMLKLTQLLFEQHPSAKYMDYYENALYNHILSSEDPIHGGFVYYTSMRPGHYRVYSSDFNSMWCCVGTGMENHSKYGLNIYSHGINSLYVNLFIPSVLNWKEKGMVVRQISRFPYEPRTSLRISAKSPQKLTLWVRYPGWVAKGELKIKINGRNFPVKQSPVSYIPITRNWKNGDRIDISLPMHLRYSLLPYSSNPQYIAILYGPILLAGEIGTQGLQKGYNFHTPDADQFAHITMPLIDVPAFVGNSPQQLLKGLKMVDRNTLTFRTSDVTKPHSVQLIPFYNLHFQRYAIYWQFLNNKEWEQRAQALATQESEERNRQMRTTDTIAVGREDSEKAHDLTGELTRSECDGDLGDWYWRDAYNGGYFSYRMKVNPDKPMILRCTYWGEDDGARTFDILVDGVKIGTQTLHRDDPAHFIHVEYPIPASVTSGKTEVTVKFQAHPGNIAGGLWGCVMLESKS